MMNAMTNAMTKKVICATVLVLGLAAGFGGATAGESQKGKTRTISAASRVINEFSYLKDLGQKEMAIIASSSQNELSMIRKEKDLSVMTYYIVEELTGKTGLSEKDLFNNIKPEVQKYVKKNYPEYKHQTIEIQDDLSEPLILNP